MKKETIAGTLASGMILIAVAANINGSNSNTQNISQPNSSNPKTSVSTVPKPKPKPKSKPVCDGSKVTSNCVLGNVSYKTYIYHKAVPEKSHTEQVTTYDKRQTGVCTLCNDGTYSPTCATGRGACSHHGGVAQWNAPRYSQVPVTSNKTVIDSPAKKAYYEKVTD